MDKIKNTQQINLLLCFLAFFSLSRAFSLSRFLAFSPSPTVNYKPLSKGGVKKHHFLRKLKSIIIWFDFASHLFHLHLFALVCHLACSDQIARFLPF
jgi:hypothetical protein